MENQRLPGDTSYSDSQAAHSEPQTTFPGTEEVYSDSQTAYSKPQAAYPDTQLAYSKTEDAYLESQGSFSDTEDAYEEPQLGYADLYPDSAGYAGTGFASFPIQNQPGCSLSDETGEALGMPEPTRPLDCPPGLECLSRMDEMLILQDIRLLDVFANFLTNNKYQMRNSLGQTVLFAVEDSEWYSRITCGTYRPFTLRIFNNMDQEVITLERPLRCSKCCFPWFLQELKVQAPPGVPIGYVMQIWHPRLPMFIIQNAKRKNVLNITGPCNTWNCCKAVNFEQKSHCGSVHDCLESSQKFHQINIPYLFPLSLKFCFGSRHMIYCCV
ncbi:phospholipid scramblase 1 isoform X2 [Oryctolagus cuniculus]|uniref:phospholipid scramblase 1 isoform X2 n=1 Tax=Oryctolagus cuniculus TaxID=9986 RepID=UPI00222E311A|nr:phospholipid scramblase 1 isoform X2 [Oryctolagus cuniculus]